MGMFTAGLRSLGSDGGAALVPDRSGRRTRTAARACLPSRNTSPGSAGSNAAPPEGKNGESPAAPEPRPGCADGADEEKSEVNEIAIYAVETKAIIQILWGLLLITAITLVSISIMYVLLRLKVRSYRRREAQLARHISTKADENARLEEKLAQYAEMEDGIDDLKAEVRRADAIRGKTEERLVAQNAELEKMQAEMAEQASELARLRKIVEHVDDL
jgi:hypothetical protein